MSHFVPVLLIIGIVLVALVALGLRGDGTTKVGTGVRGAGGSTRERMAADIRATKTSRVVDEVAILDELDATSPGYRQYCELVGTAQTSGGIIAPYSRREVAYYEISCYRIENRGGGDVETLVAHETSIAPFSFTDGSTDTPVYVDIASFGDNVILVNSTNHIEGPNSDFARAADAAGGRAAGTTASAAVMAAVGAAVHGARMLALDIATVPCRAGQIVADAVVRAASRVVGNVERAGAGVAVGLSPALTWAAGSACDIAATDGGGLRVMFAGGRPGGYGPGGPRTGGGPGGQGRFGGRPAPHPDGPVGRGTHRPTPLPPGIGQFLGGVGGFGYSGVPRVRPRPRGGTGELLTGMALGALLGSLASGTGGETATAADSFRGYRLVEDVVPLGSPVYCIGELYRSGGRVSMGASHSVDYPTSYFATRPEAEVLSRLGG